MIFREIVEWVDEEINAYMWIESHCVLYSDQILSSETRFEQFSIVISLGKYFEFWFSDLARLKRGRAENQISKYFPSEITMENYSNHVSEERISFEYSKQWTRFTYKHLCLHQIIPGFLWKVFVVSIIIESFSHLSRFFLRSL